METPKVTPARTIKVGDAVHVGGYGGVVGGDPLSPGGMRGHMMVWLFLKKEPKQGPGSTVIIQRAYIKTEDLAIIEPHALPFLFDAASEWMEQAEKQGECLIRALSIEELIVK